MELLWRKAGDEVRQYRSTCESTYMSRPVSRGELESGNLTNLKTMLIPGRADHECSHHHLGWTWLEASDSHQSLPGGADKYKYKYKYKFKTGDLDCTPIILLSKEIPCPPVYPPWSRLQWHGLHRYGNRRTVWMKTF